jgi:hypothetical protein
MSDPAVWLAAITGFTTLTGTLGGTLGGYWFAGRNEEKRDERTAEREADARRVARAERLADQRHEIQRQTLFELQDELRHLSRFTFLIIRYDRKTIREQGVHEGLEFGQGPEQLDVADEWPGEHELDRPVAEHLIRQAQIAAGCVRRFRHGLSVLLIPPLAGRTSDSPPK